MHRCIRNLLVPASLSAALLLGACGGDDSSTPTTEAPATTASTAGTPGTPGSPTTAGSPGTAPASTGAPSGQIVQVVTSDYAFGGIPDEVPAGTRFEVTNASTDELHELVVFPLPDTETRSVDEIVHGDLNATLAALPQPALVVLAPPGGGDQIVAVGDGTLSEPGRYLAICTIPTGADAQAYLEAAAQSGGERPDVPGGPPHFVHGMYAEINVA